MTERNESVGSKVEVALATDSIIYKRDFKNNKKSTSEKKNKKEISLIKSSLGYPDVGDNVYADVIGWLSTTCGQDKQWFIPGVCECNHRIAKIIACGKEWCSVCGKMGSMAHNRRYVRWLPKIMQYSSMRYLVFTIPENMRDKYRSKKELTLLGHKVQEMFKRHGYNRGLRRWHFFGDKYHKYHPHLNVLIDGGYMDDTEINSIKNGWARILNSKQAKENVHVQYKSSPADMAGCLHYVTRATFLDYKYDIEMAMELRGFRNMVVWGRGKWNDMPVWELSPAQRKIVDGEDLNIEAIENIIEHKCPKCGSHITWHSALPAKLLELSDKLSYGAGYYMMIDGIHSGPDRELELRLSRLKMELIGRVMLSKLELKRTRLDNMMYNNN